jgi:hypothetical protein
VVSRRCYGVVSCHGISCSGHFPVQLGVDRLPPPPSGMRSTARNHRASPQGAELTADRITFFQLRGRAKRTGNTSNFVLGGESTTRKRAESQELGLHGESKRHISQLIGSNRTCRTHKITRAGPACPHPADHAQGGDKLTNQYSPPPAPRFL